MTITMPAGKSAIDEINEALHRLDAAKLKLQNPE